MGMTLEELARKITMKFRELDRHIRRYQRLYNVDYQRARKPEVIKRIENELDKEMQEIQRIKNELLDYANELKKMAEILESLKWYLETHTDIELFKWEKFPKLRDLWRK